MGTADQITSSALQLFYRQGYHATGVDQLSQEAGVTKRTLYRHFPSKELLIGAALELRDRQFMARLQAAVEGVPPPERPLAYVDFIAAWGSESDFHGCAFINAAAEYAEPAEAPHGQARAHKDKVQAYLARICAEAGLANADLAARQLYLLGEGLIVATQVSGPQPALAEAARSLVATWFSPVVTPTKEVSP